MESKITSVEEKGIHQVSKAIALNMLSKGIDIATIAEVTDLTGSIVETFLSNAENGIESEALQLEQGLEKGLEQGVWKAKVQMALSAHQMGLPVQTISQLTGLGEDEVSSILQES